MKQLFLITTALFFTTFLFSQDDETLFSDIHRIGAFGGPIFDYSNLDSDAQAAGGGGGAIVLNDFFLGGYGLGTYEVTKADSFFTERIKLKHGGFWIGYVPAQHKVIHPFASVKLGWGKARYLQTELINKNEVALTDNVFVVTPEAGIELNVFSFFRIAATANYRVVSGLDKFSNFSESDLSNFGATLTLRFGGFGSEWD